MRKDCLPSPRHSIEVQPELWPLPKCEKFEVFVKRQVLNSRACLEIELPQNLRDEQPDYVLGNNASRASSESLAERF